MGKGTKRKKSDYYSHRKSKKSKSLFTLEPGLKGFICTCNNREKECVRESYNILNEYADQIYGEEKWEKTDDSADAKNSDDNDDSDIDKALEQEVDHLKAERKKDPSLRRFQVVESGANNCLFIRTTIEDPVKLTSAILKDLVETKKQKTRYLLRMIPVETTCKAWPEDIRQAVDKLLDQHFVGAEKKSYSVVFNRRNNGNVPREDVIKEIAAGVRERNPLHMADLKNPQFSIIVEIIRNMCCLAVVPDYFKYRRYNLLEVCSSQNVCNDSNLKGINEVNDSKQQETVDGAIEVTSVTDSKQQETVDGAVEVTTNSKQEQTVDEVEDTSDRDIEPPDSSEKNDLQNIIEGTTSKEEETKDSSIEVVSKSDCNTIDSVQKIE